MCRYVRTYQRSRDKSVAEFILVNHRSSDTTIRCVSTEFANATMLRSPAATRSLMRSTSEVRYSPARYWSRPSHGNTTSAVRFSDASTSTSISTGSRNGMSTAQTKAHGRPASAAARRPRPVATSGPTPRTSSRSTSASTEGMCCPGAAITKTGAQRCLTTLRTYSSKVPPKYGSVALSRPIRREAPPARTTAANWSELTSRTRGAIRTSVNRPGIAAPQKRLQRGRLPRAAHLLPGAVVVGGSMDLAENTHHGVLQVLLRQARQRERVARVVGGGVVHDDLVRGDVGGLGHLDAEPRAHHAVLTAVAERDRLALMDVDQPLLGALFAQQVERAVVENRAVLQDLDEGRAAVLGSSPQHL